MATRYNITLPNGMKFTLYYSQEQDKAELISKQILEPWTGYCLRNWLSEHPDAPDAPETKVKRLLDRCGTLLLRDVPRESRNTLSSYKESMIRLREINASDCPACIAELMDGNSGTKEDLGYIDNVQLDVFRDILRDQDEKYKPKEKKKPRPSTRFQRLEAIRRQYPGCQMRLCQVDVNGDFQYENERYRVDSTRGKYAPHKTRYGDQYDMDRILLILLPDGGRAFADQDGYLLDAGMVTKIER